MENDKRLSLSHFYWQFKVINFCLIVWFMAVNISRFFATLPWYFGSMVAERERCREKCHWNVHLDGHRSFRDLTSPPLGSGNFWTSFSECAINIHESVNITLWCIWPSKCGIGGFLLVTLLFRDLESDKLFSLI